TGVQTCALPISDFESRVEPDHAACLADAMVQLVILGPEERLVETAEFEECLFAEDTQIHRVRRAFFATEPVPRIARAQRGRHCRRDGALTRRAAHGDLHAPHVVRTGSFHGPY